MYKSEIRPSWKINLIKCRAFEDATIELDFPGTVLIGPNGGRKTTISGTCALAYSSIAPRQFFARNKKLSIIYNAIDRNKSKVSMLKRTANFASC